MKQNILLLFLAITLSTQAREEPLIKFVNPFAGNRNLCQDQFIFALS